MNQNRFNGFAWWINIVVGPDDSTMETKPLKTVPRRLDLKVTGLKPGENERLFRVEASRNCVLLTVAFLLSIWVPAHSQSLAPEIFKVDPPSWWIRSSANPIRLLIRGTNLRTLKSNWLALAYASSVLRK